MAIKLEEHTHGTLNQNYGTFTTMILHKTIMYMGNLLYIMVL